MCCCRIGHSLRDSRVYPASYSRRSKRSSIQLAEHFFDDGGHRALSSGNGGMAWNIVSDLHRKTADLWYFV